MTRPKVECVQISYLYYSWTIHLLKKQFFGNAFDCVFQRYRSLVQTYPTAKCIVSFKWRPQFTDSSSSDFIMDSSPFTQVGINYQYVLKVCDHRLAASRQFFKRCQYCRQVTAQQWCHVRNFLPSCCAPYLLVHNSCCFTKNKYEYTI